MYVKLFGSILDSSIWSTDVATRVVWITMLAMADEWGVVNASVGGLARRACVSERECRRALRLLASPDKQSRTKADRGRRITEIEGGWTVINYRKYRELRTKKQVADAMRQAKHRAQPVTGSNVTVTPGDDPATPSDGPATASDKGRITTEAEAEAYAEAEAEAKPTKSKALVARGATGESIIAELTKIGVQSHVKGVSREAKARLVFGYWCARWDRRQTHFDAKRAALLKRRLAENADDVSELLWVVDGAKRDTWEDRSRFAGIEQLFKDRASVEKFVQLCHVQDQGAPHPQAVKYGYVASGDERERPEVPAVAADERNGTEPEVGTG